MSRDFCWQCGSPRKGEPFRSHVHQGVIPTGETSLMCMAQVYHNGKTNEETHICNECILAGLRYLKAHIDEAIESLNT